MGRRTISVLILSIIILLVSSCDLLLVKEINIFNPTDEPVEVKCYDVKESNTFTIPAFGTVTKTVSSSCPSVMLFEEGRYYNIAHETKYLSSSGSTITLSPNCAYIKIKNLTGSTVSEAKYGFQTFFYDENMLYAGSTIQPYFERWIRISSYDFIISEPIKYKIGPTQYQTIQSVSPPKMGTTLAINLI